MVFAREMLKTSITFGNNTQSACAQTRTRDLKVIGPSLYHCILFSFSYNIFPFLANQETLRLESWMHPSSFKKFSSFHKKAKNISKGAHSVSQTQKQVPECIDKLAQAGLKIWLLTGDKKETAVNVG